MKNSFSLIGVILVILVAGLLYFNNKKAKTASTTVTVNDAQVNPETSAATTVNYDGSKFTPSTLTVKSGQTVTFVNNSNQVFQPASDPHPTHTGLPGFDAKQALGQGQSYSFTFVKLGSFGYHNYLSTSQTGTIVVE